MGNSDQLLLMLFSYASVNSTCAQPPLPPGPLRGICPPCQSRGWGICKKRQKGKKVAVLTKNGAFALFFRPHPGGFDSSRVPTPGNLPSKVKKMLMPGGQPVGGGDGRRWNWLMHYGGKKMKRKREWSSSLQRFSQTVYIPKGSVHSFPAENI